MIDFKNTKKVLEILCEIFPDGARHLSSDILTKYEGEVVYDFFNNKEWSYLAINLDFSKNGEALEKGCLYLNNDEMLYYFPLYIYASLINDENWAFEHSFFLFYLTPSVMDFDFFFHYIERFNEPQKKFIYEFILYKAKETGDLMAMDALDAFWDIYT